jgi:hypothetical protein
MSGYVLGIVRMNSNSCIHTFKPAGKLDCFSIMPGVGPYRYPPGDARGDATLNDSLDIGCQWFKGQVTMCINKFHCFYGTKAFS